MSGALRPFRSCCGVCHSRRVLPPIRSSVTVTVSDRCQTAVPLSSEPLSETSGSEGPRTVPHVAPSRVGPAELSTAASEFHVPDTVTGMVARSVCRPSIMDHPGHGCLPGVTASGPRRAGARPLPVAARSVTSVIFKLTPTPLAGDSQGIVLSS